MDEDEQTKTETGGTVAKFARGSVVDRPGNPGWAGLVVARDPGAGGSQHGFGSDTDDVRAPGF